MKLFRPRPLGLAAALIVSGTVAQAAPQVVASVKPVHSLVAAVMGDLGSPYLLVKGGASPHTYSLRPSEAEALENAELVFWLGHDLEVFLDGPLETLAADATVVELTAAPGLTVLPPREGGAFEAHDDEVHGEEAHGDDAEGSEEEGEEHAGERDLHLWLDPENAKLMVAAIADALAEADPENADAYRANATAEAARLEALIAEIDQTLAPVKGKPFIVFHDAYQYFEARFGVPVAGTITVSPETLPGAQRIAEIHEKVGELGATCVFAEPQFEPKLVSVVTEGTGAKSGTLDPLGAGIDDGPGLYAELMRRLANSLVECLGR